MQSPSSNLSLHLSEDDESDDELRELTMDTDRRHDDEADDRAVGRDFTDFNEEDDDVITAATIVDDVPVAITAVECVVASPRQHLSGPINLPNGPLGLHGNCTPQHVSANVVVVEAGGGCGESPILNSSPFHSPPLSMRLHKTPSPFFNSSPRLFRSQQKPSPNCPPLFTAPGIQTCVDSQATLVAYKPPGRRNNVTIYIADNVEDIAKLQQSTCAAERGDKAVGSNCSGSAYYCVALSLFSHCVFITSGGLLVWQAPLKNACLQPKLPPSPSELLSPDSVFTEHNCKSPPEYSQAALVCASVFLCISFLLIVLEALVSDTSSYVHNFMNNDEAKEFCQSLRTSLPVVTWSAKCYHYETKSSGGRKREEKVVTHTDSQRFHYAHSEDVSGDLPAFPPASVTRVDFEVAWGFSSKHSADRYKYFKEKFKQKNEGLDEHYDFEERVELDGFEDRVAVYQKKSGRSMLMRAQFYWLFTCLLLTWPYRAWFRASSVKVDFLFVKKITV